MRIRDVALNKCLQVSRFFSLLRWGIFVIVDKFFFRSVGRGEENIILLTEAKKKKMLEIFFFFVI